MVKSFEKVFQEFQCNNRFKSGRPQCELNKGKFTLHFSKEKDYFIHDWKKGWETSIEEAQTLYAQFLYNEGSAYFYGLGKCVINHEKSREAWVRASNLGHNAARGRCHFFGYSPYSKDSIKTIECWTDAMNEGDPEVRLNMCGAFRMIPVLLFIIIFFVLINDILISPCYFIWTSCKTGPLFIRICIFDRIWCHARL